MKEFKVILRYSANSFQTVLSNKGIFFFFLIAKLIRIGLFLAFLHFLLQGTAGIGEFTQSQMIFFYLSFNLMDTLGQLLFREVYRFRPLVISGGLDQTLVKPIHPLIRVLLGGPDVIDLAMLSIILTFTVYYASANLVVSPEQWVIYLALLLNGVLISAAFHILVLGIGVATTSVDHLVMIYRDLTSLMRIPVDLYIDSLRVLLTFILPIAIMFTFPAKALMGLLSWQLVMTSFGMSILALYIALRFWSYSLRSYQSASS